MKKTQKKQVGGAALFAIAIGLMLSQTHSNAMLDSIHGSCFARLSITNHVAKCASKAIASSNSTIISGTMRLYKTNGVMDVSVKSWDFSGSKTIDVVKNYNVSTGTYKLVMTAKINNGKKTETVTKTATAKC